MKQSVSRNEIFTGCGSICKYTGEPYFLTDDIAKAAMDEIIKPFMEEHPEFKW